MNHSFDKNSKTNVDKQATDALLVKYIQRVRDTYQLPGSVEKQLEALVRSLRS